MLSVFFIWENENDVSYPLGHFPGVHSNPSWATLKPVPRSSIYIFHMGVQDPTIYALNIVCQGMCHQESIIKITARTQIHKLRYGMCVLSGICTRCLSLFLGTVVNWYVSSIFPTRIWNHIIFCQQLWPKFQLIMGIL